MVSPKSQHSNCAYAWMDYITSPEPQAQVAEWFGEAPANLKACDLTSDKNWCTEYHAADKAYSDKIWYWTTPISQCLDGRRDVQCTNYGDWTQAWTEIKG
jgi:putative spermidine/putrescine transport system substrate-binding protein